MRYSCDDIKRYLNHDDLDPENQQEFLNHIENCRQCGHLINLEPELEETLASYARNALPESLEENILIRIGDFERKLNEENQLEKLLLPIAGFFSALPIFLTVWFWDDIKTFFLSLDLNHTYISLISFFSELPLPEIDFMGVITGIANSPLVILSLLCITVLVWTFSILEAQKALK